MIIISKINPNERLKNQSIKNSKSPSDLKLAYVTPCYKTKTKTSKNIYKPISILPNIFKTFEKCLYNQIQQYFDKIHLNINVFFARVTILCTV